MRIRNVADLVNRAELALAAYADLRAGATAQAVNIDALAPITDPTSSRTQALSFAARYPAVIASYDDLPGTGFQATVFKDTPKTGTPGYLTLAIRGTESSGGDLIPTDSDIWAGGAAYDQIVAMVIRWAHGPPNDSLA